ncbi:hypothetical protein [Silvibacterium acidisoli]|uniref:hypothetical protein n=1 Tax=Acidobacteriaceae bacterium ZG23-2 TaxID=2883246 RepID=UPI00406C474C
MKRLMVAAMLIAYGSSMNAEVKTWEGFVTDTHCGTNCQRTSSMTPDKACVRRCVRRGSKYGLWYGNHVYELDPQVKAGKFAAENVRVTGEMVDDTIRIRSIERVLGQTVPKQ